METMETITDSLQQLEAEAIQVQERQRILAGEITGTSSRFDVLLGHLEKIVPKRPDDDAHLVFRYAPADNASCSLCNQPHSCRVALACYHVLGGDSREHETCMEVCAACLERHGRDALVAVARRVRDEMVQPWVDDASSMGRQELSENQATWDPVVALAEAGRMTVPPLLPVAAFSASPANDDQ